MPLIRKIYVYAICLITLIIAVVGAIMFINYAINTWLIESADYSNPSSAVAMIVVATPLFIYHWYIAHKDEVKQ